MLAERESLPKNSIMCGLTCTELPLGVCGGLEKKENEDGGAVSLGGEIVSNF